MNKLIMSGMLIAAYFSMGDGGCSPNAASPSSAPDKHNTKVYFNSDICASPSPTYWSSGTGGRRYEVLKAWEDNRQEVTYKEGTYTESVLLECQTDGTAKFVINEYY